MRQHLSPAGEGEGRGLYSFHEERGVDNTASSVNYYLGLMEIRVYSRRLTYDKISRGSNPELETL
jgi:hypothetical protein